MKSRLFLLTAVLVTVAVAAFASGYDTIRIEDIEPLADSRRNAVPAVKKAMEMAKAAENPLILFAGGRYDFWPHHCEERTYYESNTTDINPKRLAIFAEKINNLVIDGNGAEFVFHDRMQPVTLDHCDGVTIRDFTIDWDIPLTAQAEVLEIEDDHVTLKINKMESPYIIEDGRLVFVGEGWKSAFWGIMEMERNSRLIAPYTGDRGCCGGGWGKAVAREIAQGIVRIDKPFGLQRPEKGNFLILRHSQRDHAGMFFFHSNNIKVENVDVYHTAGLGILSQFSENISMDRVRMIPNPKKHRYLSGHDDGFHFSNCKGQISITNCEFAALMDDPVNIHGTSVRIMEKRGDNRLLCRFMHHQSVGLQWARSHEKIAFIENESMATLAKATVKEFIPMSTEEFEIVLDGEIPPEIKAGDALENLTWTPDAHIADNRFLSCRARGILVSTPGKVVIERNYFESSGSAILIAGDANNWYESGAVRDVLIRQNVFADPCLTSPYQFSEAVISIYPEIPKPRENPEKFHRNIRIVENEFHPFDYPVLYARSVNGLIFNDNKLVRSHRFKPWHRRKNTFTLEYCANAEIAGNAFEGDILGMNVLLKGMKKRDCRIDKAQGLRVEVVK